MRTVCVLLLLLLLPLLAIESEWNETTLRDAAVTSVIAYVGD